MEALALSCNLGPSCRRQLDGRQLAGSDRQIWDAIGSLHAFDSSLNVFVGNGPERTVRGYRSALAAILVSWTGTSGLQRFAGILKGGLV